MAGEAREVRGAELGPQRRRFRLAVGSRDAAFLLAIVALLATAVLVSVLRSSPGSGNVLYTFDVGQVRSLLVSPADTRTLYALESERLSISRDGGRSWEALLDRAGWGATSITADATSPDTLYAAGPELLERSDDGGRTWRTMPGILPGSDIRFIVASPTDAGVLFIHFASGAFYQSDDSGATWMPRDSLPGEAKTVSVAQRVCCQETLYAAVPGSGAWVGSSDGRLWQRILDSPQAVNAVAIDGDGRLIVGTDTGVYATADRGKSWETLALSKPIATLVTRAGDARTIFAIDNDGRLYRSGDGGKSW